MNVHSAVELRVDACIADAAEVRNVVRVELGELLTDEPDVHGDHAHASIGCEGAIAILRVDDPITHHSLWRRIPLGNDATQPRLLALALVELVAASWADDAPPAPAPAPPAPPPPTPTLELPSEARRETLALFTSGGTWFSAEPGALVGPGVRIAGSTRQLGWLIDAQFRAGTSTVPAGSITTDVIALGAAATLHVATARARFDVGAGLRGGEVRMAGTPAAMTTHGSAFWSPWCGAFVLGTAAMPLTDRLSAALSVEAGHVISPVAGLVDGQRAAAVDGSWLQVDVGFGYSL
jgi:hypothetical protein